MTGSAPTRGGAVVIGGGGRVRDRPGAASDAGNLPPERSQFFIPRFLQFAFIFESPALSLQAGPLTNQVECPGDPNPEHCHVGFIVGQR